jgi:glycyl-tRNA synthetase beta chain
LGEVIAAAARGLVAHPPKLQIAADVQRQVADFLLDRARFILRERHGFAYDEINAALVAASDDLVDAVERISALRAIRKTRNFEPLAVSFKRIRNILEKAGPPEKWALPAVRPELFQSDAEKTLHSAARRVAVEAEQHRRTGEYREALQRIATLRPEVDEFFNSVMVMAEQEELRRNRLTLLAELLKEFSTIADFSELAPAVSKSDT